MRRLAFGSNEVSHFPARLNQLLVHGGREFVHQAHRLDDVPPEELESVEAFGLPKNFIADRPFTRRPRAAWAFILAHDGSSIHAHEE